MGALNTNTAAVCSWAYFHLLEVFISNSKRVLAMTEDNDSSLRQLYGPIRRRKGLILATIVMIVGLVTLVAFAITPIYSAVALVFVDPSSKNLLDPNSQQSNSLSDNARVDSEVEILRSQAILVDVVLDKKLFEDPEFAKLRGWRERAFAALRMQGSAESSFDDRVQLVMEKLKDKLSITRLGSTYVISIEVQSENAAKAADLANTIANKYISAQINSKIDGITASRDVMQIRITRAGESMQVAETAFERFIAENIDNIPTTSDSSAFVQLRNALASTKKERENSYKLLQTVTADIANGNWTSVAAAVRSDTLTQLSEQRLKVTGDLAAVAHGGQPPLKIREELQRIESQLRSEATKSSSTLQRKVAEYDLEIDKIAQNLRTTALSSDLPTEILTRLYQLQQDSEVARAQYQTLLSRLRDVEAQADLQLADSRVVSTALAPAKPSFPKTALIIVFAAVGAGALGVCLAFIFENLIGGFTSEEQVASVLGLPRVFPVPLQRHPGKDGSHSLADLVIDAPYSAYTESMRRLWVAIEQTKSRNNEKSYEGSALAFVVMVSSSLPNEGKTTIALSLARVAAGEGYRTLLVDCDLRRPSVHSQTGLDVRLGLHDFLATPQSTRIDELIKLDPRSDLHILAGRRGNERPAATLLASKNFANVIGSASKSYEFIILDTPPLRPIVDGLYVAPLADMLVFTTNWATTSQADVKISLDAVSMSRNRPIDVVCALNKRQQDGFGRADSYNNYYVEA